jgi:hypothetical protein
MAAKTEKIEVSIAYEEVYVNNKNWMKREKGNSGISDGLKEELNIASLESKTKLDNVNWVALF